MLLFFVTASCLLFGSAAGFKYEEKCYGGTLTLPFQYVPVLFKGQMYFTPSGRGSRKLIMDNGEAKDPRLRVSVTTVEFRDLRDEGTFSISNDDHTLQDIIKLKISDCSERVTEYYGDRYSSGDVPREVEFVEFTPLHSRDQPAVLWNRTDPQTYKGGRLRVTRNGRSMQIQDLTQSDNGHYNFREKDNTLVKRIKLEVKEHVVHQNVKVSERLRLEKLFAGSLWSVTFIRKGNGNDSFVQLIERGELVKFRYISWRLWLDDDGIEIQDVDSEDSGTYEFRDQQGNLAQTVTVDVMEEVPTAVIIGITVGIVFVVIVCCCCIRKRCCKKSSTKRDESTLPVYNHDSTQPAGPSYSAAPAPHHSYQPINSRVPQEPSATSLESSVNNPVNIHVNPLQPEDAPLGGQRTNPAPALGSDCLSSDPGPQFELKGLTFLTAPPLSSDQTFSDVYSSDKLNFL